MKLLILSDIHANIDALRAVWKDCGGADKICCAGDVIDYGFYPCECIDWLAEHRAVVVSGNHDRAIAERIRADEPAKTSGFTSFAEYNYSLLNARQKEWLVSLPRTAAFTADGIDYRMKHFHREENEPEFIDAIGTYHGFETFCAQWEEFGFPDTGRERRLVYGHTHRCMVYLARGTHDILLNPGSISYRVGADSVTKGGDYLLIEDGRISFGHVDYPTEHLLRRVAEFPDFLPFEHATGINFYTRESI